MARSLTVKPEDDPRTSPLLTAFLLIAFGWLLAAALISEAPADDAGLPAPTVEPVAR